MRCPPKRFPKRVTFALLTLAVAAFAVSWIAGSALLAPAQRPVLLPARFDGTEVTFPSRSGAQIHGNFIESTHRLGVVILMHGVRGNRAAFIRHADLLRAHGYSVLLFDFQAHGESIGQKITNGYLESMDARAAVEFVKERAPGEKIAILGSSLGGAAALLAEPPLPVDGMILELVYVDIERAVKNRGAIVLGQVGRLLSPMLTWQLRFRLGKSAAWFSPERAIPQVTCPKLVIAGALDRHTTLEDSRTLFKAAQEPKELWVVEQAGHEDVYALTGPIYEDRILRFLDRALAK